MTALELRSIAKSFGPTRILGGVDLQVEAGEFLTLVGPSGCGKSTLLRILAGLEPPDTGQVVIDGQDVTNVRPAARNLAMVFQSYALYPHLSVADNMLTPLHLRDLSRAERLPLVGPLISRGKRRDLLAQVQATAETLQITNLLHRKPGQLSGGQRQRVALGRAMVRRPVAFLMDEPLSNLDAALRVHMRAELTELHRALGATFVYVTHDQAEALTMSTRVAVIMGGEILQIGTPDEVYSRPKDLRVAAFIGSPRINILPGEAREDGALQLDGRSLRVSSRSKGPVQIGMRPEHLVICRAQGALLSGTATYRENLGSDVHLHMRTHNESQVVVVRATPAEAARIEQGDDVYLTIDPANVLAFEPDGQRIATTDLHRAVA